MIFNCLTIFPEMFSGYLNASLCKKAIDRGDIEIYLPYYVDDEKANEETGFTVNYSKASGDINSEFPLQGAFDSMDGKAIYGNGKSEITVDIASGDVEIKKNKLMSTN